MTHRLKNAVLELSNWSKIYKKLHVQWVAIVKKNITLSFPYCLAQEAKPR